LAPGSSWKKAPNNLPNRWADLVVTGLAVGAGTKPLHDLTHQYPVFGKRVEVDVEVGAARQASERCSMCCSSIHSGSRNQM
jgi:hypothetical protein